VIVYVKFSSVGAGTVWGGGGSSLHSGIEFGRSMTSEVFGGEEEGGSVRSRPGALGPSYFFMSLVLDPARP
jgi:hypothetical protein